VGGGADPDVTVGGWHEVARADDLPEREVRRTSVGRTELVVWRQPNGTITCQEAWCPHAWADLRGALVTDDGCIECPFHGWRFDAAGWRVQLFAPSGRRERLRTYAVRERDGVVLAWVHPYGEPPPPDLD
jgi:phenylpropionate dioxygenase-like ring-hydroxylating dioxygenase large terminal subunit